MLVHNLICHKDIAFAIKCLSIMKDLSFEDIRIIFHDDGSLYQDDIDMLRTHFPDCSIILRSESDEKLDNILQRYPYCKKLRYTYVQSLKMLDIPLLCEDEFISCCDGDILFFKPFKNLFSWPDDKTVGIFMKDFQEAYSLYPWQIMNYTKFKLVSRINSGTYFFKKRYYDLDFIEWFLENVTLKRCPYWLEQTIWASMLRSIEAYKMWDSEQFNVIESVNDINNNLVGGHFTTSSREFLHAYLDKNVKVSKLDQPIVELKTTQCVRCNPVTLMTDIIKVRLNREIKNSKLLSRIMN